MSTDLIEYVPPKLLTEREVRVAGVVSNQLCVLRSLVQDAPKAKGSVLTVTNAFHTTDSIPLKGDDLVAVLGLLIERGEQFLTGLNIELEGKR